MEEYDARTLQLVRSHLIGDSIQTLAFSPDSRGLAIEDNADVVRLFDSCDICKSPSGLARVARRETLRQLTPDERATFGVS